MTHTYRPMIKAFYAMGTLLVLSSVLDPAIRTFPFQPQVLTWRFGAVGLFSDATVGVLFGGMWLLATAAFLDNRRTARVLSAFAVLFGLALAAVIVVFSLDALQIRAGAAPGFKPALDASVIKALTTMGLTAMVSLIAGTAGWRATKFRAEQQKAPRRATSALIDHQKHQGLAVAGDRASR